MGTVVIQDHHHSVVVTQAVIRNLQSFVCATLVVLHVHTSATHYNICADNATTNSVTNAHFFLVVGQKPVVMIFIMPLFPGCRIEATSGDDYVQVLLCNKILPYTISCYIIRYT